MPAARGNDFDLEDKEAVVVEVDAALAQEHAYVGKGRRLAVHYVPKAKPKVKSTKGRAKSKGAAAAAAAVGGSSTSGDGALGITHLEVLFL